MKDYPTQAEGPANDVFYSKEVEYGLNRMTRQRTKLQRLNDMKRGLEAKLVEVNNAIGLLEANPEINKVIEALEKAGV